MSEDPDSLQKNSVTEKAANEPVDAAGIYLRLGSERSAELLEQIKGYWHARGAYGVEGDISKTQRGAVDSKGKLGVGVLDLGDGWHLILDSERVTADAGMAEFLATKLGVEITAYVSSPSVGKAWLRRYDASSIEELSDLNRISNRISAMPGAFKTIPAWPDASPTWVLEMKTLSFEGIGLMGPKHGFYGGPDLESRGFHRMVYSKGTHLLKKLCLSDFNAWADTYPKQLDNVLHSIRHTNVAMEGRAEFVLALKPLIEKMQQPSAREAAQKRLAQAAFCLDDRELFESVFSTFSIGAQVWELEALLFQLGQEQKFSLALKTFERLMQIQEPSLSAWNNLCFILAKHPDLWSIDAALLRGYLEKAESLAPQNSSIFHNLACVQLRLDKHEAAMRAVMGAFEHAYPWFEEKLLTDPELSPLHKHSQWATVLAAFRERTVESRVAEEKRPSPLSQKNLIPKKGIDLAAGFIGLDDDLDDIFKITGDAPSSVDSAMMVYRFEQLDLTITPKDGAVVFINHQKDWTRTFLLGLEAFEVELETMLERLRERYGEPEVYERGEGEKRVSEYAFEGADTLLWCTYPSDGDPYLQSIWLLRQGQLKKRIAQERKKEKERARAKELQETEKLETRRAFLEDYHRRWRAGAKSDSNPS